MSGSFEKSVKGGTKIKLAPPKAKYVEHILVATHAGDAGVAEVFRALQNRLRDSTWTIVFKALIIVHLMVREGEPNVTLKFLAETPSKLAISNFSDVQIQGTNIRHYYNYILARAKAYRDTRIDWVREGQGRLKKQTVDKGLLRETESVQHQISNLLRCDLLSVEAENDITVCAFRLLTMDLLVLYGVMNEGTINVLEHYFEMSKPDAERALQIYKAFTKQTNGVVEFLGVARQYENATRLEIPKLKHAPTSLTSSLEEYLNDPDFEINRRQYLAQQDAKKGRKPSNFAEAGSSSAFKSQPMNKSSSNNASTKPIPAPAPAPAPAAAKVEPKGPAPDLIDFFDSIEQNQQPMATQPQTQQAQFQFQQQQPHPQQQPQLMQSATYPQQQVQMTGFNPQQPFLSQNGQIPQNNMLSNTTGFSSSNPFGPPQQVHQPQPVQGNFTGTGFGGYTPQSFTQPQDSFSNMSQDLGASLPSPQQQQQQQQSQPFSPSHQNFSPIQQPTGNAGQQHQATNPFRQSTFPQATGSTITTNGSTTSPFISSPPPMSPQSTNPFARNIPSSTDTISSSPFSSQPSLPSMPTNLSSSPFTSPPPSQTSLQSQQLTPQRTGGTNPFARSNTLPTSPFSSQPPLPPQPTSQTQPLVASQTGTNPFRQSAFVNQSTGQGWQSGQGTMGGLEQWNTIPVFPRPGGGNGAGQFSGQPPQPQHQQSTWS